MHVALLVDLDLDPASAPPLDALASLADLIGEQRAPLSVHVEARLLEAAEERPELVSRLADLEVEWVRTGWGGPDPALVPEGVLSMSLDREGKVLERLGLTPGAFWVRRHWHRRLPLLLDDAGVSMVLCENPSLPRGATGVVTHLDRVLGAAAVADAPAGLDPPEGEDGLEVWRVSPTQLGEAIGRLQAAAGCDLTTPSRFAAGHPLSGRLHPAGDEPDLSADTELLHRKLVRLATRLPERPGDDAVGHLLRGAHHAAFRDDTQPEVLIAAHSALVRARAAIDAARRRGDDWGRITEIDWDADGVPDLQLEQPELSVVIDPAEGGRLLVLDDKGAGRVLGTVPGEPPGALCLWMPGSEPRHPQLTLDRFEEGRQGLMVELSGRLDEAGIRIELRLSGRRIELRSHLDGAAGGRLGPELTLALSEARLRVDGSTWTPVVEPTGVAGHRFRLEGSEGGVLVTSMIPLDLFARPTEAGVVVWPAWPATDSARVDLGIELLS